MNLTPIFQKAGYEGSFVLYNLKEKSFAFHNQKRAQEGFLPASTFKVLNSLIGLETGVIKDANHEFKWDGKTRKYPAWNKDHTLQSAIKYSVVWYYQKLARQVGATRMKEYLAKTGYGNGDISAGLDRFWLKGGFRVTSMEQIKLLRALYANKLPFSRRNQEIVKTIMLLEKTPEYTIRAKTGLTMTGPAESVGWYIGYVETKDNVYFFATNLQGGVADKKFADARKDITRQILRMRKII